MKYKIVKIEKFPLKEMRKKAGFGLRTLAKAAGLDYTHLFRLEKEQYIATEKTMQKINQAFLTLGGNKK